MCADARHVENVPRAIAAPAMPGIVSPFTRKVLNDGRLLHELATAFGGPLNYVVPAAMHGAIAEFRNVADARGVDVSIYFAKKANKARAFIDVAARADIGVDVSSSAELEACLARGIAGARLSVSGGCKAPALLELAVRVDALIACDTLEEIDRIEALARAFGRTARLLLRFRPPSQRDSRFGFAERELGAAAKRLAQAQDVLDCLGLSFHCNGYDPGERAIAARCALEHFTMMRGHGLTPSVIDVGGGFTVAYREPGTQNVALEPAAFHAAHTLRPSYPYTTEHAGSAMLARMLDTHIGTTTLAESLKRNGVTLIIEPGRALLDQAGFTATRVLGVRERDGYGIVTVDATSFSLSEQWFNTELFVDPVLVPTAPTHDPGPWRGCIAGASCLESDMLAWRKIPFSRKPEVGDLLCFVNTAGYHMDSNESDFHSTPVPTKIVLWSDATGAVRWCLDGVRAAAPQ